MSSSEQADAGAATDAATDALAEEAELVRLRAENEALRAELGRDHKRGRLRAVAVGLLVAIAAVTFTTSIVGVWARRSVLNNDVFVSRVVPLASDPDIQAALTAKLTDEIMTLVDPQSLFEAALPERGKILAGPLTGAIRTFVADQVRNLIASDSFAQIWATVVARGHEAVLKVLNGESQIISTEGSNIKVDLTVVINAVLARIGEVSPQLFGRTIDIPTLTAEDLANAVPEQARQALADALGRPIPTEFGVIEIQGGGDSLSAAQTIVRISNTAVWALVILTIILIPLALWISRRRRRTLIQLTACLLIGTVLVRRVLAAAETTALGQVKIPGNKPAVQATLDAFLDPLHSSTTTILVILLLVALAAVITGPYPWMVKARTVGTGLFHRGATSLGSVAGRAVDPSAADWVRAHRGTLQGAGVAVGVLALLIFNLSFPGMIVLLAVLGGYLAAVWWITEEVPHATGADELGAPPSETPSAPAPF